MYQELMEEKFPGKEKMSLEIELVFRRKAIERAWQQIKTVTKQVKPNCIIWLSSYDVNSLEYEGTSLLKEIDWLQSEYVDIQGMQKVRKLLKPNAKQILCTANAKDQQSFLELVANAVKHKIGINDFARADDNSMKPPIAHYLSNPLIILKLKQVILIILKQSIFILLFLHALLIICRWITLMQTKNKKTNIVS